MNDRGENIVRLAKEILSDQPHALAARETRGHTPISLTTFLVVVVITALTSSLITSYANDRQRPLTRGEKVELEALIYYAAHQKSLNEGALRTEIQDKLHINSLDDLTSQQFLSIQRFLRDKLT